MKNTEYQLKSHIYLTQTIFRNIDELVNVSFNDSLDMYGCFNNELYESLKDLYKKEIEEHLDNIYEAYNKNRN